MARFIRELGLRLLEALALLVGLVVVYEIITYVRKYPADSSQHLCLEFRSNIPNAVTGPYGFIQYPIEVTGICIVLVCCPSDIDIRVLVGYVQYRISRFYTKPRMRTSTKSSVY